MSHEAHVASTKGHSYICKNDPTRHGFIYKNTVETEGKCTMILPIPTKDVPSVKIIDTTAYARMMDEFRGTSRSVVDWMSEIEQVGMYSLIIGRNLQEIHQKIGISISQDLSEWLVSHYPEAHFTFITCAWEGDMNAQPIQIEYTPTWESHLFFPMMEAHGEVPKNEKIIRNHLLTVSTGEESDWEFRSAPHSFFKYYSGIALENRRTPNGDLYIHIEDFATIWKSDDTNICFEASPF